MSQVGALLGGIAAVLWVLLAVAVAYGLRGALAERLPFLTKLGVSPSGVSMEFAEARLAEASAHSRSTSGGRIVGQVARETVLQRLTRNADLLGRARILWVDDHPENNESIVALLRQFGSRVDTPRTNSQALQLRQSTTYHVIISDVARDMEGPNSSLKGLDLAQEVFNRFGQKVLLFTARFNPATLPGMTVEERLETVELARRVVFGITNYYDEALHLILDVLERQAV